MEPRYLFVGGPGRSGTTYLANLLSRSSEVASMRDVELKFFGETGGLPDLYNAIVTHFGLHRSRIALISFRNLFESLYKDVYSGQVTLESSFNSKAAKVALESYLEKLASGNKGYPKELTHDEFGVATRTFVSHLYKGFENPVATRFRLEKTPHNLLNASLLFTLFPGSCFVHITRDPRAIVTSLKRMSWGPSKIEDCISWYSSYHHSWQFEQRRLLEAGIPYLSLRIEDFYFSPASTLIYLNNALQLKEPITLTDFNFETLCSLQKHISVSTLRQLDSLLAAEIADGGYQPGVIGHLLNPDVPIDNNLKACDES